MSPVPALAFRLGAGAAGGGAGAAVAGRAHFMADDGREDDGTDDIYGMVPERADDLDPSAKRST